jgi:hypothetical protein
MDTATVVVSAPVAARSGRPLFVLVVAVCGDGIKGSAIARRVCPGGAFADAEW